MSVEWKIIPGAGGGNRISRYEASDDGRVRSVYHNGTVRELKGRPNHNQGHLEIAVYYDGKPSDKQVGCWMLLAFVGSPSDDMVNPNCSHLDGYCLNNNLSNLRWESHGDNLRRKNDHGTDSRGENHVNCKLTDEDIREIRDLYKSGDYRQWEIAEMFGIDQGYTSALVNQKRRSLS